MRKRYYLHTIETNRWQQARSVEHALELAATAHGTWRVMVRIGSNDPVMVRHGVSRAA